MRPAVTTRYGKVRGQVRDGVASFLGIPYAASPTGPPRFRPPAPPPAWDGVRDADGFSATPPKPAYAAPFDVLLPEPDIAGDDWLTVNVWTPDPGGSGLLASSMAFIPVVDGDLLPVHPLAAMTAGAGSGVRLLTGTTTEEYRLFPAGGVQEDPRGDERRIWAQSG